MCTKACILVALCAGASALTLGVNDPADFHKEKVDAPIDFNKEMANEDASVGSSGMLSSITVDFDSGPMELARTNTEYKMFSQEYRINLVRQLQAYTFDDYVKEQEREYIPGTPEYNKRAAIFQRHKRQIIRFAGLGKLTWTPTINKFMDQTKAEFTKRLGYKVDRSKEFFSKPKSKAQTLDEVPADFTAAKTSDWRKRMTYSVDFQIDQGACGSCWAAATTHAIEAHADILFNMSVPLSMQEITSCTPNPRHCGGSGGCDGATAELALDWLANSDGLVSADKYEYTSKWGDSGKCDMAKIKKPTVLIGGYTSVPSNNLRAMMYALTKGPLIVAVDAKLWSFYGGGIFNSCGKDATINHAVTLVGYGHEEKQGYWLIRNSWGKDWGQNGYIQLARSSNTKADKFCGMDKFPQEGSACDGETDPVKVCGMCGILYEPVLPVVTGVNKPENFEELIGKNKKELFQWEAKYAKRKTASFGKMD